MLFRTTLLIAGLAACSSRPSPTIYVAAGAEVNMPSPTKCELPTDTGVVTEVRPASDDGNGLRYKALRPGSVTIRCANSGYDRIVTVRNIARINIATDAKTTTDALYHVAHIEAFDDAGRELHVRGMVEWEWSEEFVSGNSHGGAFPGLGYDDTSQLLIVRKAGTGRISAKVGGKSTTTSVEIELAK